MMNREPSAGLGTMPTTAVEQPLETGVVRSMAEEGEEQSARLYEYTIQEVENGWIVTVSTFHAVYGPKMERWVYSEIEPLLEFLADHMTGPDR